VPSWGSFSYAYGPVVALGALAVLVLVLRWAFARGQSVVEAPPSSGRQHEYGLLTPVAEPTDPTVGAGMERQLRHAGVRATYVVTDDGPRVMVWPEDADRAREILQRR
jgi:hypothetical protein